MENSLVYAARKHAYQRTDDYLFSQLIPYIGSKRKLLGLIDQAVALTKVTSGVFADLFAGSGVVSRYAKSRGFRTVANDWEPYSYVLNAAAVSLNKPPCSVDLFDQLNALPGCSGYITRHYCPNDDAAADPHSERMYYTRANGMKIDAIRSQIAEWKTNGEIDSDQMNYLLAPLIASCSYTSNTSGVFKAYHNGWGGKTSTALYRIMSDLVVKPVPLFDNGQRNHTFAMDAVELASGMSELVGESPAIVYLDPPYNQHPYGSNYHLLNSIALWDCPDVPDISMAKSAIRADWSAERRSSFNSRGSALNALEALIDKIECRWILMSYSTDGNIPLTCLITALNQRGSLDVVAHSYKRYRVSSQRMSARSHNVEFILVLDTRGKRTGDTDRVLSLIAAAGKA